MPGVGTFEAGVSEAGTREVATPEVVTSRRHVRQALRRAAQRPKASFVLHSEVIAEEDRYGRRYPSL